MIIGALVGGRRYHCFTRDVAHGIHHLHEDELRLALTNRRPDVRKDEMLTDIQELESGPGYAAGGVPAALAAEEHREGLYTLVLRGVMFTATDGPIGPFQYIVLYNGTRRGPVNPLIAQWRYALPVTMGPGEVLTIDLPAAGVLTIGSRTR
jgi:hypothetical protein